MLQSNQKIQSYTYLNEGLDFIFESVEMGVLIENMNRQVEFANQVFCDLFNIQLAPHQLKGTSIIENLPHFSLQFEDAAAFEKSITQIPATQLIKNEKWKTCDGKILLRDYIPLFKDNELKGHIWMYREQKQTTTLQPQAATSIIENAFDHLPGEIAIFDTDAKIVFANKAYISSNEKRIWAKGKTLSQYFSYANLSTETALFRMENIKKAIQEKQAVSWEELSIAPTKSKQYHLRTCYPVFNTQKQIESVIEQSIDISVQKSLEARLKQVIQQFFNTLDKVNDIIIQTNDELKLEFINKAWEEITGQSIAAYNGNSIFDILSVKRYELYGKMFAVLSGEASEKSGLLTIQAKDGKEKYLQYNLQPTFSVDDKQGVLATFTDITNQQLQQSQLLELVKREKELNELKTAFVNMVSHELRTPLTVISSSAEILDLMLQSGKSHGEVSIYTKQIIDEVEKMTAFMQDLLMVSKIEAGKIELNPSPSNIAAFIEKVVANGFNPWKDGRSTDIQIKRTPVKTAIDEKMLEHALHNLLTNAFKYSSGKANPVVRVSFAKTYFTISVVDNGIGIPAAEIEKLFTSFFRATNAGNISGTGIGLIVTKYFTEQHKGYVLVKSQINKGTIFTLKLPYLQ